MPDRLRLNMEGLEGAGHWVEAPGYGYELPPAEQIGYLITKTDSGSMSLAVRGYREGEEMPLTTDGEGRMAVTEGEARYPVLSRGVVMPVGDEDYERYREAVRLPEEDKGWLIQVLEQQKQGRFDLLGPAEYNDYDSFAQLVYGNPRQVALRWGSFGHFEDEDAETSAGGYAGYKLKAAIGAYVLNTGPLYAVVPYESSQRRHGIIASSIDERTISNYPTLAQQTAEFSEADQTELDDLAEAANHDVSVEREVEPTEIIYGRVFQ
jgi:hypothetical protein